MSQKTSQLKVVTGATSGENQTSSHLRDDSFRLLVESVQDYAIFMLDPNGLVMSWNSGAKRIKGYAANEIIGEHFSRFYSSDAKESRWPDRELEIAAAQGRFTDEGWRVRKDGTTFWASVVITALRGPDGELQGYSKVTRDLTERRALEERTQELNRELRSRMAQLAESRSQLELRTLELQRLSGQLLHTQDEERRRLARELHDDLGQELVALKMSVEIARQHKNSDELSLAIPILDRAMQKVRNMSYILHPPLLDESGLIPALHSFLEGFKKRSGLNVTLETQPASFARFSREIETSVFRVIQECLLNVYRHSGSADARIEVHQQLDRIIVRVRDFGKGIPLTVTPGGLRPIATGAGIGGMKERLKQFGGDLKVSRVEPGTLVEANIPLFES